MFCCLLRLFSFFFLESTTLITACKDMLHASRKKEENMIKEVSRNWNSPTHQRQNIRQLYILQPHTEIHMNAAV